MKRRIGNQLALAFAVPLGMVVLLAATAFFTSFRMAEANRTIVQAQDVRRAADALVQGATRVGYGIQRYVLTGSDADKKIADDGQKAIDANLELLRKHEELLGDAKRFLDQAILAAYSLSSAEESFHAGSAERAAMLRALLAGAKETNQTIGATSTAKIVLEQSATIGEDATQIVSAVAKRADAAVAQFRTTEQLAMVFAAVMAAIAIAGTLLAGLLLTRRLVRRLRALSQALHGVVNDDLGDLARVADRLAEGDLTAALNVRATPIQDGGGDEIGELVEDYNALCARLSETGERFATGMERLRGLVGDVAALIDRVSSASAHVASATSQAGSRVVQIRGAVEEVAGASLDDAARLRETSTAVEALADTSTQIASGATSQSLALHSALEVVRGIDADIVALAEHAAGLAKAATGAASESQAGSEAMAACSDAMRRARVDAAQSVEAMQALEARTSDVGAVLEAIDEIAEQTNLLALNAAIEAARAGEHGRGFAVVADEVRKLAERATQSTKEIGAILDAIRTRTHDVAETLRGSNASLDVSLRSAERAGTALSSLEGSVVETRRIAGELSDRSGAMKSGSGALSADMASISSVVEQNAASAEEMGRTTESVSATLRPVVDSSQRNAEVAGDVAAGTGELTAAVSEMASTAEMMRAEAEGLREAIARFTVQQAEPLALEASGGGFDALEALESAYIRAT